MIPTDCVLVKPKKDVAPFTHLTWNSNGCPKAIPLDIYELNEYRLVLVEDPHNLVSTTVPEYAVKVAEPDKEIEHKPILSKVKTGGKGKNRKR